MREILSQLTQEQISRKSATLSQSITHIINTHEEMSDVRTIALFAAHGTEVNLASLHQSLPRITFLYPLCRPDRQLSFHEVTSVSELLPGTMKIEEPQPERHKEIPLSNADLILCPGLAFGRDGSRLGHGGGYYDRAIQEQDPNLSIPTCGVAFQNQVFDTVPYDHHDIAMDYLLTENGIHSTTPDRG